VEAFLGLLDLPSDRFTASSVLDLLDLPEIAARLDLSPGEAEIILAWVRQARIRWGYDGEARAREGLPPFSQNSWREGLDRLLLGYAAGADREGEETAGEGDAAGRTFAGLLPCGPVEGGEGETLGKLVHLVETLHRLERELREDRPLAGWALLLDRALDDLFAPADPAGDDLDLVRQECLRLRQAQERSRMDLPVGLPVVRHALEKALGGTRSSRLFLDGKATFCALLPMRSVPSRVIALLGMNGGVFPRRDSPPSFSRLSPRNPGYRRRQGDRSLRAEDRLLFLETLLSARDRLIISYTGQSLEDDSEIQPSVAVSELLDAVEWSFCRDGDAKARELLRGSLLTRHPLQPFSPAIFDGADPRLFSHSEPDAAGARALAGAHAPAGPLCAAELPEPPPEEMRTVSPAALLRFFRNPSREFLRRRLRLEVAGAEEEGEDAEPLELSSLERHQAGERILSRLLAGGDPAPLLPLLQRAGALPPGGLGEAVFRDLRREAAQVAEAVREAGCGGPLESLEVDLPLGPFRVAGRVAGIAAQGVARPRMSKVRDDLRMALWIEHLILRCAADRPAPRSHAFFRERAVCRVSGPADPRAALSSLLDLYWRGLSRPLPYFPAASRAFARALRDGKGEAQAADAARSAWRGGFNRAGEGDDPDVRQCFPVDDPTRLDGFAAVARAAVGPLLEAEEERP
jgi:exodeoxyribonuclease V gamma subunit